MSFEPKKKIPTIAAAGLALVGCGEDSSSAFQQAAGRIDNLDPAVTAFCMKYVACYPDGLFYDDADYCRAIVLGYMDSYVELSDDPDACLGAAHSYFDCVERVPCETAEAECQTAAEDMNLVCNGEEEPK